MLYTAYIFGLLSSLHCVGMCGPIAMALPVHSSRNVTKYVKLFLYHLGRLLSYAALGTLFGVFGRTLNLSSFQQTISIVIGFVLLSLVFIPKQKRLTMEAKLFAPYMKILRRFFPKGKRNYFAFLTLGVFNGLLPCGMVYMALVGALATGTIFHGTAYMFFFGLGTLPLLVFLHLFQNSMPTRIKTMARKAMPALLILLGCFFIVRGAGLEIPYISLSPNQLQVSLNPRGCGN